MSGEWYLGKFAHYRWLTPAEEEEMHLANETGIIYATTAQEYFVAKRLERMGYLEEDEVPISGYRHTFHITEEGRKLYGNRQLRRQMYTTSETRSLLSDYQQKWKSMGATQHQIDMATKLANDWTDSMVRWLSRLGGQVSQTVYDSVYREGLNVADKWIQAMRYEKI